ncbi:MAG TPA: hypothetical protein VG737_10285 [Cyclobacteriaceae bacterium]|nr:hypothetical protein [Cyclobacteriaceae bacterium]
MQKRVYNILFFLFITFSGFSADTPSLLTKADSLYAAKQYTQAFERYEVIFAGGRYSPAMLLRMAYIQEGLSHLGESLYYINLYFLASNDTQALKKMEELAEKNKLEGYQNSDSKKLQALLQEHFTTITLLLVAAALLMLALMFYLRTRKNIRPAFPATVLAFILVVLFIHINFSPMPDRGIVASPRTYLMSGPSAGSSLVAIIGEGHQLEIKGKKDVWLRVQWKDREAYVKEFLLKPVRL